MTKLYLFGETPRAGQLYHVFLVPAPPSAAEEALIVAAKAQLTKPRTLLVSRLPQRQQSGRIGEQILVLTPLNLARLTEQQQAKIQQQLDDYNKELAEWVEKENWQQRPNSNYQACELLPAWLDDLEKKLPKEALLPAQKPAANKSTVFVALAAAIVLGAGAWWVLLPKAPVETTAEVTGGETKSTEAIKNAETVEKDHETLAETNKAENAPPTDWLKDRSNQTTPSSEAKDLANKLKSLTTSDEEKFTIAAEYLKRFPTGDDVQQAQSWLRWKEIQGMPDGSAKAEALQAYLTLPDVGWHGEAKNQWETYQRKQAFAERKHIAELPNAFEKAQAAQAYLEKFSEVTIKEDQSTITGYIHKYLSAYQTFCRAYLGATADCVSEDNLSQNLQILAEKRKALETATKNLLAAVQSLPKNFAAERQLLTPWPPTEKTVKQLRLLLRVAYPEKTDWQDMGLANLMNEKEQPAPLASNSPVFQFAVIRELKKRVEENLPHIQKFAIGYIPKKSYDWKLLHNFLAAITQDITTFDRPSNANAATGLEHLLKLITWLEQNPPPSDGAGQITWLKRALRRGSPADTGTKSAEDFATIAITYEDYHWPINLADKIQAVAAAAANLKVKKEGE